MTTKEERWAEALAVERPQGGDASRRAEQGIHALEQARDTAGVKRMRSMAHRLEQLAGADFAT